MQEITIWLYPGFLTKGLKGKLLWHGKEPIFDEKNNDWTAKQAVDVTNCINDPWPFIEGGRECCLTIKAV